MDTGKLLPSMTSHSGFLTRWSSVSGSRSEATLTLLASLISSWVRWRMKMGFPRHLMMTYYHSVSPSFYPIGPPPNGPSTPPGEKTHVLALGDVVHVDLNLGHGQDIGGGGHVDQEFCNHGSSATAQSLDSAPSSGTPAAQWLRSAPRANILVVV